MTCPTCNGWGVTLQIASTPPSSVEKRKALRKDPKLLILRETICMGCGGYGTKPDDVR